MQCWLIKKYILQMVSLVRNLTVINEFERLY